jgi:phenylalanyl-tRNA synthetase alpha chain
MDNLDQIVSEAQSAFAAISDPDALEQVKARFLGKSGQITELLKGLGKLPPEEKKTAGAAINVAKTAVENALNERREAIRKAALEARLAEEALDVTLPGRAEARGGLHPVTRTLERIEALFRSIGFEVADGPEIEEDFFNFTAMNTPEDHPARSMHDTFYLQNRTARWPTRCCCVPIPARSRRATCRRTSNATVNWKKCPKSESSHRAASTASIPMRRIRRCSIRSKACGWVRAFPLPTSRASLPIFCKSFFETDDLKVRFRPSFFPFTEPSAEIDVAFMSGPLEGRWLEIAGCGMVHPDVLRIAGIDPEKYTGFAFGFGQDRLTMLRYGVNDLRLFFEGDLRFLRQFA